MTQLHNPMSNQYAIRYNKINTYTKFLAHNYKEHGYYNKDRNSSE